MGSGVVFQTVVDFLDKRAFCRGFQKSALFAFLADFLGFVLEAEENAGFGVRETFSLSDEEAWVASEAFVERGVEKTIRDTEWLAGVEAFGGFAGFGGFETGGKPAEMTTGEICEKSVDVIVAVLDETGFAGDAFDGGEGGAVGRIGESGACFPVDCQKMSFCAKCAFFWRFVNLAVFDFGGDFETAIFCCEGERVRAFLADILSAVFCAVGDISGLFCLLALFCERVEVLGVRAGQAVPVRVLGRAFF